MVAVIGLFRRRSDGHWLGKENHEEENRQQREEQPSEVLRGHFG